MDNLRTIAGKYYTASSEKTKKIVKAFIDGLDKDGNGRVNYYEFKQSLKEQGYKKYANNDLFADLHKNGDNKDLEFADLITLYYIIMSGRPFCHECDRFIQAEYFGCKECFENQSNPVCVCPTCYEEGNYYKTHSHGNNTGSALFLDTYALLESQRLALLESKRVAKLESESQSQALAALEKRQSQTQADLMEARFRERFALEMAEETVERVMLSSTQAIVLASTSRKKHGGFMSALKTGLETVGMIGCTIM